VGFLALWTLKDSPDKKELPNVEERQTIQENKKQQTNSVLSSMTNPNFRGMTDQNHPYNINAAIAIQNSDGTVRLEKIDSTIELQNNQWYKLTADIGIYNYTQNTLDLSGSIIVKSHDNVELETESAYIKVKDAVIYSNDPVTISGNISTLSAQGFSITGGSETIDFTGPVELIITADR
jgi:LPS export ABC transporter protein LptC